MRAVKLEQLIEIHIRNAIAPGQHKRFISYAGGEPLDATSGLGVLPGFHQVNDPVKLVHSVDALVHAAFH